MTRDEIVNSLVSRFESCRYLEIGSKGRECFSKIRVKVKHDIEPYPANIFPVFKMTSDEFFFNERYELIGTTLRRREYDVIFIDGLHFCEQVIKDVYNSSKILSKNGFIVIHDCIPEKEEYQYREFNYKAWAGDVWKAQAWLTKRFPNVVTINNEICGCGIISGSIRFELPSKDELLRCQWREFSNELLRITKWEDFKRKNYGTTF